MALVAFRERLDQLRQPAAGVGAPVVPQGGAGRRDDLLVAGHQLQIQQPDRGRQIRGGDPAALTNGPDAVVKPGATIPDRVPDAVRQGRDLLSRQRPAVVQ